MSLATLMDDPNIPADVKRQVFARSSAGDRREYYYERYARDPARKAVEFMIPPGPLGFSKDTAKAISGTVVPPDLQGAGEAAASMIPGSGLVRGAMTEAGGITGGMAQGRGAAESALRAAPGAILNATVPWFVRKALASRIAQSMSSKASSALSSAAGKLFSKQFAEEIPKDPALLADFFQEAGPALKGAGDRLSQMRRVLGSQPAFAHQTVTVPVKTLDPITKTPIFHNTQMYLKDALDYQQAMYGRGYLLQGGPRGGIMAEPDREIAAQTRRAIDGSLRKVNPRFADMYQDLAHDYGVARTMGKVVTKDTVTPEGLLGHEKVYSNAYDPKNVAHMNSLVGPQQTRDFLAEIAPGRQRIMSQPDTHVGVHGIMARLGINLPNAPTGPSNFTPTYPSAAGPIAAQGATNEVENLTGDE